MSEACIEQKEQRARNRRRYAEIGLELQLPGRKHTRVVAWYVAEFEVPVLKLVETEYKTLHDNDMQTEHTVLLGPLLSKKKKKKHLICAHQSIFIAKLHVWAEFKRKIVGPILTLWPLLVQVHTRSTRTINMFCIVRPSYESRLIDLDLFRNRRDTI